MAVIFGHFFHPFHFFFSFALKTYVFTRCNILECAKQGKVRSFYYSIIRSSIWTVGRYLYMLLRVEVRSCLKRQLIRIIIGRRCIEFVLGGLSD